VSKYLRYCGFTIGSGICSSSIFGGNCSTGVKICLGGVLKVGDFFKLYFLISIERRDYLIFSCDVSQNFKKLVLNKCNETSNLVWI
jgi:hypothetical protein